MNDADNPAFLKINDDLSVGVAKTNAILLPGGERTSVGRNSLAEYDERIALFGQFDQFEDLTDATNAMIKMLTEKHIQLKELINASQANLLEKKIEHEKADADANIATREYEKANMNVQEARLKRENAQKAVEEATKKFEESRIAVQTAKRELQDADQNVTIANKKFDDTDRSVNEATQKLREAEVVFGQSLDDYEPKVRQLQEALNTFRWYKSQEKNIWQRERLSLFQRDTLGQTYLPSIIWEIPIQPNITETIELKPLSHNKKWEITGGEGKWQVLDNGKAIILIRRKDQKIQIEWTEEVKNDFDISIKGEDATMLTIIHNIDQDLKIARQKDYHLLDTINTSLKPIE